jgi:DNA-binding transcriptional LysR family regulator
MLPCFMADCRPHLVAVLPDEMLVNRTFYASMHEDNRSVSRVKAVWNWLKEIVATHEATLLGTKNERLAS